MIKIHQITKNQITPNLWDGGLTFEYFIFPNDSNYTNRDFDFRISSATIEKIPSQFTRFNGFIRYLVMLDTQLKINRNNNEEIYEVHQVFSFDSSDQITSYALGSDFNLMLSNKCTNHQMLVISGNHQSNAQWIIWFALSKTRLFIDGKTYDLLKNDALIVENQSHLNFDFSLDAKVIFAQINF